MVTALGSMVDPSPHSFRVIPIAAPFAFLYSLGPGRRAAEPPDIGRGSGDIEQKSFPGSLFKPF
jgi:hypothetical protein